MLPNVVKIGSPIINNGIASGFSSANYLKITDSFDVSTAQSWEVVYKIKTGTDITTGQSMCGHTGSSNYDPFTIDVNSSRFQLGLCNTSSTNLLKDAKGTYTVLANTTYWLKLTFDGSRYALSYSSNGVDFIEDVTLESTTKIWTSDLVLGRQQGASSEFPFLGSIDLNESYIKINGEVWWTGMVEGGIKPLRSYILKRRETKYYKEVVVEGESYACFTMADVNFYYLKKPYGVGDYFHYTADGGLATTISELVQSTFTVYKVNSDGSVSFYTILLPGGDPVEFPLPPYPSGDLTTTTTELVESTKDDYDIVKTEDSFYSLMKPKVIVLKNWNQPVLSANDGYDNFSVTNINIANLNNTDYQPYKAFDYNNSTEWRSVNNPDLRNGTSLAGLTMRFGNTPVNITSLEFTNSTRTPISPVGTFDIYGYPSLTSTERVLLMRYDNTTTSSGTSWSVDLSDNKGFYPQYGIVFVTLNTVNNSTNAIAIAEIKITGTYQNISDNPYLLIREKN